MTSREPQIESDEQHRLQTALRGALGRAPELQMTPEFSHRLRDVLQHQTPEPRTLMSRRSWLALAASLVLVAGVTGRLLLDRPDASSEMLAQDAIGDHEVCALKLRPAKMSDVPLPEASATFNEAYRMLIAVPLEGTPAPGGPIQVVERHTCDYNGRRFGHVVMRYQGHLVSLLVTTPGADRRNDMTPQRIGQATDGLSVVSVNGSGYAVLMVSDLGSDQLRQLSTLIAQPLAQRLQGGGLSTNRELVMALDTVLPFCLTDVR